MSERVKVSIIVDAFDATKKECKFPNNRVIFSSSDCAEIEEIQQLDVWVAPNKNYDKELAKRYEHLLEDINNYTNSQNPLFHHLSEDIKKFVNQDDVCYTILAKTKYKHNDYESWHKTSIDNTNKFREFLSKIMSEEGVDKIIDSLKKIG